MCFDIEVGGLKAHLSEKWKRLMTARKVMKRSILIEPDSR
jgi:hypothetical protein